MLPRAIAPEHAQRAIDSCDLSTANGLRDRAVLLLLARLGLRACEVIALQLDDSDWIEASCEHVAKAGVSARCRCPSTSASRFDGRCRTMTPQGQPFGDEIRTPDVAKG